MEIWQKIKERDSCADNYQHWILDKKGENKSSNVRHSLNFLNMDKIQIKIECKTCVHSPCGELWSKSCKNFSLHEWSCTYCKYKFENAKLFCDQEDEHDGSFNCCGDKFEFNSEKFVVLTQT